LNDHAGGRINLPGKIVLDKCYYTIIDIRSVREREEENDDGFPDPLFFLIVSGD
jgi:hypothetical protein